MRQVRRKYQPYPQLGLTREGPQSLTWDDVAENLSSEDARQGGQILIDSIGRKTVDVGGLVAALIKSGEQVYRGQIDVRVAARSLLGVETRAEIEQRAAADPFGHQGGGEAIWKPTAVAEMAASGSELRPGLVMTELSGVLMLDGHHRLGAHVWRELVSMPVFVVSPTPLAWPFMRRLKMTRQSAMRRYA